jgi:PTH1 family peptidyl-tRNA hydrolase
MLFSKPSGVSWLVAFLGNPGPRYEGTRHNAGFMTADAFARAHKVEINRQRFRALTGVCELGEEKLLLMKPQTFMNLSGEAAAQAAKFYKIPPERILVVSDDVALPVGQLRIRRKGSAGGHNGLRSLISELGSDAFPRVRIGVGAPPHPDFDMADWVLSPFRDDDAETIRTAAKQAAEACVCYLKNGPDEAMTRYNQKK